MSEAPRGLRACDGGQAVVIIALGMAGLLVGVGLAIDTGSLLVERRSAQVAADAAAWAGAVVLYRGGTGGGAVSAAAADAQANGYTNAVDSTTVSIASPPTGGQWAGDARFVEVTITRSARTFFLQGSAAGLTTVSARAVGGAAPTGFGPAILTLGDGTAFSTSGSARLAVSGGDIHVNSSAAGAANAGGSSQVTVQSPNTTRVAGTATGAGFSPTPQTGAAPILDPYLVVPEPPLSTPRTVPAPVNGVITLQPGVYSAPLHFSGADVHLEPGVYIIQGGLHVSGQVRVTGTGVMLFNTVTGHPDSTGTCGEIRLAGGGRLQLSPPTTGTYKGMVLWQDRDCNRSIVLRGNTDTELTGTIYAPAATFDMRGNTDFSMSAQVVSARVDVSGNARITFAYDGNKTAKPHAPALVE